MKSMLSAAALLAALASPALAETTAPQAPEEPVVEAVPVAATPSTSEEQAVTDADAEVQAAGEHDCGMKHSADLTN